ncbi:MAG: TonB-dependent receptor family protein, partial [Sinomicrobium sp.]|nr:TonB-dependent receptor family protein [Sinomicrobium sp.]
LNIILKQSKTAGINGSVNLYGGYPDNYGGALSLNLRSDKFNIFTNTTYQYRNAPGNALFEQENFDTDGNPIGFQDEYRKYNRRDNGFTNNLGFEYMFDATSSATSSFVYRKSNGDNTVDVDFFNFDVAGNPTIRRNRFTTEDEFDENVQYSFNFVKNFKKDGHKFTFDYQYSRGTDIEDSVIEEIVLGEDNALPTERTYTDERQKNQLVQFDYVLPLGKDHSGQFEFGYRGTFNVFDTDFRFGILEDDLDFIRDPDFSNMLIYREYVNAFYTQLGNKFGKFSLLGGLRMEASDIGIDLITTNVTDDKNYIDWFPSVFLGYEFSETEQLTVSYSRRLRRPRSRFINPFPSRSSNTNLF